MPLHRIEKAKKGYRGGKPKSVYVRMGVWLNSRTNAIHITVPSLGNFHTTVNDKQGSTRCHKNLYGKLKNILKKKKAWF